VSTSQNILYPRIVVNGNGSGHLVFALSRSAEFPSAAYTPLNSDSGSSGPAIIEAAGSTPEDSFTCYNSGFGGCRWGDYSGGAVWNGRAHMMNEYIPPATQRDFFTNWGTFVWSASVS
jgi:hypothetical protein